MEKLLQWSIANSQGDKEAMARAGQPDPKLLQQLFGGGGPDDPTLMKESMAVIMNPEVDLETKLVAFDNFEMLIENLDNANNIENLKLWEPLLDVLVQTKEEELRAAALSIIGTAVQNNLDSQNNFMKYDNGLRSLIEIASDKTKPLDVRTKAFYALSNLIRNHKDISEKFFKLNGLDCIAPVLSDNTAKPKLKMRAIALLTAYLSSVKIDENIISVLRKDGVIESTIECLSDESNLNIIDRVLSFLSHLISSGIKFNEQELHKLNEGYKHIEPLKDRLNEDDYLAVKYVL
ncbi:BAH_G0002940.mRNA.1.CDS.1 [Saccharomyces cerevisiae]|nr:SX2_G0015120.mRNA.1.CDS.1 [Saccharomyces cerevisiae]CAD6599485.1 HLJ1_G0015210.mRNA.1.CDS.1 [Saccharomyces cerevisiae]CAI4262618.1 BAH_G0002940.mRNA.1.CDS.1 [Saccharomyces cerevisiae]CAI4263828.1 BAG_1a_G0002950.mRNA.1.CDS.1 [Saccharomyces cerevisiae]CAI4271019.1 CCN_G0003000.mRNA.1.CDS.1 [Saccharomyces cerevisiae]